MNNIDINKEVDYIYFNNIEVINNMVGIMIKEKLRRFNLFTLDEKSKYKFEKALYKECGEKVKRQIEYKIIIEKLYLKSEKKEALFRLPHYILDLR